MSHHFDCPPLVVLFDFLTSEFQDSRHFGFLDVLVFGVLDLSLRIYGLLGLVPKSSFNVDYYHATTRDVYVDLVHQCLHAEQSLDIITLCRKTSSSSELPSWVPDWTASWVVGYGEDYKAMDDPDPPPIPLILKYGSVVFVIE